MMENPFDQFDSQIINGSNGNQNPFDQFDQIDEQQVIPQLTPKKIGKAAYNDFLRKELEDAGTFGRNLAGAGTALSNLWEGAKQFVGKGDADRINANKIISEEAPVGAFAGNLAATALPFGLVGNSVRGAAAVGAGIGALEPVSGDQGFANVAKGKLLHTGLGAVTGAAGQFIANKANDFVKNKIQGLALKREQDAPKIETLRDALDAGLVVPPSSVNPTGLNTTIESVAGKIGTAQNASNKNEKIINNLARKSIGLADDAPLIPETMQKIRQDAYKNGYEPIANIGKMKTDPQFSKTLDSLVANHEGAAKSFPNAFKNDIAESINALKVPEFNTSDALKASQILRDEAQAAFKGGDKGLYQAKKGAAKAIEDQIERNLSFLGNADYVTKFVDETLKKRISSADFDVVNNVKNIATKLRDGLISQSEATTKIQNLSAKSKTAQDAIYGAADIISSAANNSRGAAETLNNFREARKLMAKAHTIEDAIVEGGGTIDPRKLANRLQAGKPLSGELKTIASFANNFSRATQPSKQVAGPGVSKLNSALSAGFGAGGFAAAGPLGLAAAAAPFIIPRAAQNYLLSKGVQQNQLKKLYELGLPTKTINNLLQYSPELLIAASQ